MTSSAAHTTRHIQIRAAGALLGLATIGMTAAPKPANAWWHGYGWGVGVYVPPVTVAPPVFYGPPPYYAPPAYYAPRAYYAPPARPWIAAHWANDYWIGGHWG